MVGRKTNVVSGCDRRRGGGREHRRRMMEGVVGVGYTSSLPCRVIIRSRDRKGRRGSVGLRRVEVEDIATHRYIPAGGRAV